MTFKIVDPMTETLWGTFINSDVKMLEFCQYLEKNCIHSGTFIIWEVDNSRFMRLPDFLNRIRAMDEETFKQSSFYVEPEEKEGKARRRRRMRK